LTLRGGQFCKMPEEDETRSQNLGRENMLTAVSRHEDVAGHRQAQAIWGLVINQFYPLSLRKP